MKQAQFDKHTIAWFKIAECVSRGEKERALGVYRLLSHSFNDSAIARQLEADIYSSFGEVDQAFVLYQQTMELFHKSHRFLEAAAVGEHLITMRPDDIPLHREIVQLYISLGMVLKIRTHVQVLAALFAKKDQWYEIKNIILDCLRISDISGRVEVYSDIIITAHKAGYPWDIIAYSIEQAIDDISGVDNKKCLQVMVSLLQVYSDALYNHAVAYLAQ